MWTHDIARALINLEHDIFSRLIRREIPFDK